MTVQNRNPYAPPVAPVTAASSDLPGEPDEHEVGGFWRRVGALILDALILAPLGLLYFGLALWSPRASMYFGLPSDVVGLVYYVYLVKRFGGTPGKRLLGMRILMADGSPITTKAAFLRYAPLLAFSILSSIAGMIGAANLDPDVKANGFLEQMQMLGAAQPPWAMVITWASYAFWIATAITMLCNYRRRAIHDFIAGTAVVRD